MKKLVLMDERAPSWNGYWSGKHWTQRAADAKRIKQVVRSVLTGDETPYTVPVNILVVAYYDGHPTDSDNVCDKPYIDALKGWIIQDDTKEWVRRTATEARVDLARPRVEIEITEAE